MGITTYQFENLYAWYSWPNVILPIIGGYFVDNVFGMRLAAFIFASFILLGKVFVVRSKLLSFRITSIRYKGFYRPESANFRSMPQKIKICQKI